MSRPKKERIVHEPPRFVRFKPAGVRCQVGAELILSLDEYEAIRLADHQGLDHAQASEEMEISRSTFTRLIEKARKKLAALIVEGREVIIEGGNIHFRGNLVKCMACGLMFKTNFENNINKCPSCESENLLDLAGGFGHGRCCGHRKDS